MSFSLLYFLYCYLLTGTFLEECAAFMFYFCHALRKLLLMDAEYLEMKDAAAKYNSNMKARS